MRVLSVAVVIGIALLGAPPQARAQFVIPDTSKTIIKVPEPVAAGSSMAPTTRITSDDATRPQLPDPRCSQLPEPLRRTTPGCH